MKCTISYTIQFSLPCIPCFYSFAEWAFLLRLLFFYCIWSLSRLFSFHLILGKRNKRKKKTKTNVLWADKIRTKFHFISFVHASTLTTIEQTRQNFYFSYHFFSTKWNALKSEIVYFCVFVFHFFIQQMPFHRRLIHAEML